MPQLQHEFRVSLPVEETWALLSDLPKIAPCLPGATLDDVVDGKYQGRISTRIGPISVKYRGVASFLEHDEANRRAVIEARGREEKGSGAASAVVTANLEPDGGGTIVKVSTELTISGRAAQFGRSLLAEVSNTMLGEFVRRLEDMIGATAAAGGPDTLSDVSLNAAHLSAATGNATLASPAPTAIASKPNAEQLDVMKLIVLPLLRRWALPVLVAFVLGGTVGVLIGHTW